MSKLLFRATQSLTHVGRTLEGLAIPWDKPALVSDDGGRTRYLESFAPESCDTTIRTAGKRPLFVRHDYSRDPIGSVMFRRSDTEGGLMFEAPVSKTRAGDEALELVNDGAMGSVSGGFKPIRQRAVGKVTRREEIAMRELSLAPTGFGQVPEARVLAVRAQADEAETHLRDVINSQDADRNPAEIAQAIDATNDALAVALAAGDFDTAAALSTAIDMACDHLLVLFQVPDPDENSSSVVVEPPVVPAGRSEAPARDAVRQRLEALRLPGMSRAASRDRGSFAYTPGDAPSGWKLPLTDATGKETADSVGAAAAALSSGGFRGQKVSIPAEDLAGVKSKVRAAWKRVNPDKPDTAIPDGIKE